jgi:2'-5' RNA ligase
MTQLGDDEGFESNPGEQQRFRNLRSLTNHWSRPKGQPAFYWYLTFEHSPELQSTASRCQHAIAFPYYDLTPADHLHLTLDRIAFEDKIASVQLDAIETAARLACHDVPRFDLAISLLGGVSGAVGFTAFPESPVKILRDTLRTATLSVLPDAPVRRSQFHPHIAIAYANTDGIPAANVIAVVEDLNARARRVEITVDHVTLVRLERRPRSYAWQAVTQIPLGMAGR